MAKDSGLNFGCASCSRELSTACVYGNGETAMVTKFPKSYSKSGDTMLLICQEKSVGVTESVLISIKYCPWCGRPQNKEGE